MTEEARHSSIQAELSAGHTVTYFTVGISMRPLLRERATHATIAPLTDARNGDILLYVRTSGALVLHRCQKQDDAHYYMRGDNTYGLERIRREQAIGVVTHIYRKGRYFDVRTHIPYRIYTVTWRILYPARWCLWMGKRLSRRICK